MDFKDSIKQLSERIGKVKENILTEEATKNAFIMPFIQALGYDVFDPTEVIPELDCDLVKKRGEKIDYAIQKDGETIMLIECKHWQKNLNLHETQLQRYFVASKAKFGVLTNGIEYRFYSDLNKPNIMDDVPFLVVDMDNLKDEQINALKQFHKSYFNLDTILSSASQLKYLSSLKSLIRDEFQNPSDDLVRLLARKVYEGAVTQKVVLQFAELVKKSLLDYLNDAIADRLNKAMATTEQNQEKQDDGNEIKEQEATTNEPKVITTEEEIEGYYIVKGILRDILLAKRITYRDAQSYFSVLVDDNNRNAVCRLYFNNANKRIGIIAEDKSEERFNIEKLDDIYLYADKLKEAAKRFIKG